MFGDVNRNAWAQAALYLALMVTALDLTIVNVALPTILRDLNGTNTEGQWIIDAYTLVVAGFVLLGAGLADRYGRRRFFVGSIAIFIAGSLVAAFAPGPAVLIAGRAIMGLGAAVVLPSTLSLIQALFPPEMRPVIIGRWAMAGGIALAVGPVLGGLLITAFWWGSVFLVTVPIVAASALIAMRAIPESRTSAKGPLDMRGAALSVVALGGIVGGLIEGPRFGWLSPAILAALVIGMVALVLFAAAELRARAPMIDLGVLRLAPVQGAAGTIFVGQFLFFAVMLLVPQYLSFSEKLATWEVGLLMAIPAATFAVIVMRTSLMTRRWGNRAVMGAGSLLAAASCLVLVAAAAPGHTADVVAATSVAFVGFGLMLAPAASVIMNAIDEDHAATSSAASQVARQVGAALGVAVIGSLFASLYSAGIHKALTGVIAGHSLAIAMQSPANAEDVGARLTGSAAQALDRAVVAAFGSGFRASMLVAAALALCAGLLALRTIPVPQEQATEAT